MFIMFTSRKCTLLVIAVVFNVAFGQQDEGDPCETASGSEGVCKYLTQCPSALEDIRKGIFPRDICGYEGTQSIICCISRAPPKPTPKPTPKPVVTTKPVVTRPVTTNTDTLTANRVNVGDTADAKCKEYSQYAYEKYISPTLSVVSKPTFSKTLECPIQTQTLIVGGKMASRKEFPHMIQIGYITGSETTWDCGGSLISPRFVLTAAHCLSSQSTGDAKLARGGLTSQSETYGLQTRNVIERIKHPNYKYQKYHDIALLRLDRDFDLNVYLRPACVFTKRNIPYAHAIASGWGKTDFATEEGSNDLLKVTLEFFSDSKCNNTYRRIINLGGSELSLGIVDDWMICAGSSTEKKDTCQGDSGGPLQIIHPDTPDIKCMYDIVGITSFGIACGLAKNLPGVYTRVSNYMPWIEETVWPKK